MAKEEEFAAETETQGKNELPTSVTVVMGRLGAIPKPNWAEPLFPQAVRMPEARMARTWPTPA